MPGVPAGQGRKPRGRQEVHGDRVRVHGRGGTDPVAHQGSRHTGGQRRRVHTQDKRRHREDIHFAGQQLLRRRRGGQRRLSGDSQYRLTRNKIFEKNYQFSYTKTKKKNSTTHTHYNRKRILSIALRIFFFLR